MKQITIQMPLVADLAFNCYRPLMKEPLPIPTYFPDFVGGKMITDPLPPPTMPKVFI